MNITFCTMFHVQYEIERLCKSSRVHKWEKQRGKENEEVKITSLKIYIILSHGWKHSNGLLHKNAEQIGKYSDFLCVEIPF